MKHFTWPSLARRLFLCEYILGIATPPALLRRVPCIVNTLTTCEMIVRTRYSLGLDHCDDMSNNNCRIRTKNVIKNIDECRK